MDPKVFRDKFAKAAEYYNSGRFPHAAQALEELLRSHPDHPEVLHTYARSLIQLARYKDADRICVLLTTKLNDPRGEELRQRIPAEHRRQIATTDVATAAGEDEVAGPSRRRVAALVAALVVGLAAYGYWVAYPRLFRILEFNSKQSIGNVYAREATKDDSGEWTLVGEARGRVDVLRSRDLRLVIEPGAIEGEGRGALDALVAFEPDTFDEIDAADAPIGDDGLKVLLRFTSARRLGLRNTGIVGAGFANAAPDSPLVALDVSENPIQEEWVTWIGQLEGLESLNLAGTPISDAAMGELAGLKKLAELAPPSNFSDDGLKAIQGMTSLRALDLAHRPVTDRGMKFVGALTALETLDVSGTAVTDTGIERLSGLERLRDLNLGETYVSDNGAELLARHSELQEVDLSGTLVTPASLDALARLPELRSLNLARSLGGEPLPETAAQSINAMQTLETLDLSGAAIDSAAIAALSSATLRRLVVEETELSAEDMDGLRAQLANAEVTHTPPSQQMRRIAGTRTLGRVYIRAPLMSGGETWALWSELTGDVPLPPAGTLRIEAAPAGVEALGTLAALFGEEISELSIEAFPAQVEIDFSPLAASLELLELGDVPAPEVAAGLAQLSGVRTLVLTGSSWNAESLGSLPAMAGLETLEVRGGRVPFVDAELIAKFPVITRINFRGTPLFSVDVEAVRGSGVTQLDLRDTGLAKDAVERLVAGLPDTEVLHDNFDTRTVVFAEDIASGTLWRRKAEEPGASWTRLGEARGAIEVPASDELRLDVFADAGFDGTTLERIAPDAIHALNVTGAAATDDTVAAVARWTALRELTLEGTSVTDATVTRLGNATPMAAFNPASEALFDRPYMQLTKLNLSGARVEGRTLRNLRGFVGLREVDLSRTPLVMDGIDQLTAVQSLERIGLEQTQVGTFGLNNLQRELPEAWVSHRVGVSAPPKRAPSPARALRAQSETDVGEVFIRRSKSTDGEAWTSVGRLDRGVAVPAGMDTRLVLRPVDMGHLDGLASLSPESFDEIVVTPGARVTPDALRALCRFSDVRALELAGTSIEPGALHYLRGLQRLERLNLAGAEINRDELWALRGLLWLRELDLSGTGAGDEVMMHLAQLTMLSKLALHSDPSFSDLGARMAARLPALETVDAHGTGVGDTGFRSLAENASVKQVDVYGTAVSAEAARTPVRAGLSVNRDKRRLSELEIATLAPKVEESVRAARGERGRRIADAIGVTALAEVADDSLNRIHRLALRAARQTRTAIDAAFLADISGVERLSEAPASIRAPLQQAALESIAMDSGRIAYEDLVEVAGVADVRELPAEERNRIQEFALFALAKTPEGITEDDLALIEGVEAFDDIPNARVSEIQQMALTAMSNSDLGITIDGLATVSGVERFDQIDGEQLGTLQAMALSALVLSEDGLSPEEIAALNGFTEFQEIPASMLPGVQESAMSAMALSDRGITAPGIAALGGTDYYDDLAETMMSDLQGLAVSTMVDSDLLITTEAFSQIGGREDFEAVPEDRREGLQGITLTAMADSSTGITVDVLVEIGGVESFTEFDDESLTELQDIALLAMADSSTGITSDSLAVLAGTNSLDAVQREELNDIRTRAITAMGKSATGIQPSKLIEIMGDSALTVLNLAGSPVGDTDLLNIPDFSNLEVVDLAGCSEITDRGIERFSFAKGLRSLNLSGTKVTTQGLFALSGLSNLESLDLSNTTINDGALSTLNYFPRLESLIVADTRVEGTGLLYLAATPNLRFLDLARTGITDDGIANTPVLPALEHLVLTRTRVTDAAAASLERFQTLRALELAGCPGISDQGFAQLAGLKELTNLALHDTQVSEASVPKIAELRALNYLTVNQAMFTIASMDTLKNELPECTISGIGTLKLDAQQLNELVQDSTTAADRFRAAAVNSAARAAQTVFSLLLTLTGAVFAFVPFLPAAITGLDRLQRSGAAGRAVQGAGTGAQTLYIVITRGGSALLYASRWLILMAVVGLMMYYAVMLMAEFFDTYLDTRTRF